MTVVMSLHTVEGKALTLADAMQSIRNIMEKQRGIQYLAQVVVLYRMCMIMAIYTMT